jgi:hypothetical protein
MVMSTLDAAQLAARLANEKLVILPLAEYEALLNQVKTLESIRSLLDSRAAPPASSTTLWDSWRAEMETWIDARPQYSPSERQDLKEQVGKIAAECNKGSTMSARRLEKLINTLAVIGPDVFEVVTATLASPLGGLGVALKKIGDRAKLEHKA